MKDVDEGRLGLVPREGQREVGWSKRKDVKRVELPSRPRRGAHRGPWARLKDLPSRHPPRSS